MKVGDLVRERTKGKGWISHTEPKMGIVTHISWRKVTMVASAMVITFICTDGISMTRESSHLEVVCK